jgi:hypothetical protein
VPATANGEPADLAVRTWRGMLEVWRLQVRNAPAHVWEDDGVRIWALDVDDPEPGQ